jgi:hypothetical protein
MSDDQSQDAPPVDDERSLDEQARHGAAWDLFRSAFFHPRQPLRSLLPHLARDAESSDPQELPDDLRQPRRRPPEDRVARWQQRRRRRRRALSTPPPPPSSPPPESLSRHDEQALRDALDRALMRDQARRLPKLQRLAGTVLVDRQEAMSRSLAEANLTLLAESFDRKLPRGALNAVDLAVHQRVRAALRRVRQALGYSMDAPVSDQDLMKLLRSEDADERERGRVVLRALSAACKNRAALGLAMQDTELAAVRINMTDQGSALHRTELQTSFIKAARSKIANMLFQTDLRRRFEDAARKILRKRDDVNDFIACVGFNRAMSGNNLLGASLSSDVDFKLVIDDTKPPLKGNPKRTARLKAALRGVLDEAEGEFLEELGLTLEVQAFTIKTISSLESEAGVDGKGGSEVEKNFLSTVFENQSLMSGSREVHERFREIIQQMVDDDGELPARNFNQYLGQSDKGSIASIRYLGRIEEMVERVATRLSRQNIDVPRDEANRVNVKKLANVLDSPEATKALEGFDVGDIPLFVDEESAAKRVKLLCKNLKAFTVSLDGGASLSHNFIGREDLDADSDWIFSNKYGACRLNDFFDATSRRRYVAAQLNEEAMGTRYDAVRPVAAAVNRFAVQLQDRIYELYTTHRNEKSHLELDEYYHRLTGSELERMMADEGIRESLLFSLRTLVGDLEQAASMSAAEGELLAYQQALQTKVRAMRRMVNELRDSGAVRARDGKPLFTALAAVVAESAAFLDPSRPPPLPPPRPRCDAVTMRSKSNAHRRGARVEPPQRPADTVLRRRRHRR